ncbi:MAG: His/Gly/Thr/Pro-type tRNA ligase C-terminal domain-containing protein, partial [Eubacteriales bacterium]|nr:His/Gly/Thr/Pro-type tRNA ligase C-terminal domain-containing protein [Eubacteriales bacterium]
GTVCGGGRYDGLLEEIGGVSMPGVGFGMGMERLLLVAESFRPIPQTEPVAVYIAPMGDAARRMGFKLAEDLRKAGIKTEFDHVGRSFKAQFKFADKLRAKMVAILGDDELASRVVTVKNMQEGTQRQVEIDGLIAYVQENLK